MSLSNSESSTKYMDLDQLTTNKDFPLHQAIAYRGKMDTESISYNNSNSIYTHPVAINFVSRKEIAMNDNDLLKSYMEKVNQDQSDLRSDIRESERRTAGKIEHIEQRMDNRLNRIEDLVRDTQKAIKSSNSMVDSKLETFRSDIREHKFFRITSAIGIIGVCLATIIGIATMVTTFLPK